MPRVIVALLRHGTFFQPPDVPSAHLPYPLTPEGEALAQEAGRQLVKRAVLESWWIDGVVDTSRLLRAWQTAHILAGALRDSLGRPFVVEEFDALAERSVGSAANLTVEQIAQVLRRDPRCTPLPEEWRDDSFYRIPLQGAESLMQAGARVARHLEWRGRQIAARAVPDSLKVCVGHGGAFRHAAVQLGVLRAEEAPRLSMSHCVPVFLERNGESRWAHVGGAWKVAELEPEPEPKRVD
jgi:2,3-bisphosphoglycerate-dependent phosphoglycerate mutase